MQLFKLNNSFECFHNDFFKEITIFCQTSMCTGSFKRCNAERHERNKQKNIQNFTFFLQQFVYTFHDC